MVFSSTIFLFVFLPITLIGYFLLNTRCKNYWLLFMSIIFFGWSQPSYLWIILLNILINYCCAMLIDDLNKLRKPVVIVSVVLNLAILFYFKYFDFTIQSINDIFGSSFELKNIILPIGISFFTFQGMSYVIDVYRREVPAQKNPFKVALYIVLFPQLIAGPIVRYTDIAKEIDDRKCTVDDFSDGIQRFIIGLGKKVIIANTMAVLVDNVWSNGAECNLWSVAWIASIAYTLQIYFDFSGYSDMAIGLGRMFGFHFNENFNLPYISQNITEFWRRWHISLSSWFRDYVYIPLGGNRKRVYLNLAIVFLLTGVWHGAAWQFILWGVWNGVFILVERVLKANKKKKGIASTVSKTNILAISVSKVYTLLVVNFGWVLFRAPSLKEALSFTGSMFGMADPALVNYSAFWYLDRWTLLMFVLGILFASSIPTRISAFLKTKVNKNVFSVLKYIVLLLVFYVAMVRVVSGTYNPFIYFQF